MPDSSPAEHPALAGQPFRGTITSARDVRSAAIGAHEVVGCFGTDGAMVRAVQSLVGRGCTVKVFEDRPRAIVAEVRLGAAPRLSVLLSSAAGAVRSGLRAAQPLPVVAPVRHGLAALASSLEVRAAGTHRRRQLRDPWLRRQMTPDRWDGRTPLRSDGYYRALDRPNCELVSWPIAAFRPSGVRTCDGLEHRLDRIVVSPGGSSPAAP